MITIIVDEAYAFDYLSILDLKKNISSEIKKDWEKCYFHIESQIGKEKMNKIINSDEYKNMLDANILTFQAVEKAKNNNVTAKYVDDSNMLRYKRKIELQNIFFANSMTEKKL